MSQSTDAIDRKLPVTAELGDEGGSYGDAAVQAETLKGEAGNPRVDPKRVAPAGTTAEPLTPDEQPADLIKHAGEPPER